MSDVASPMQGRRYPNNTAATDMEPGGYCLHDWTTPPHWQLRDPLGEIGSLRTHTVEVHEDDTITVTPSIAGGPFHGWLTKGEWTW